MVHQEQSDVDRMGSHGSTNPINPIALGKKKLEKKANKHPSSQTHHRHPVEAKLTCLFVFAVTLQQPLGAPGLIAAETQRCEVEFMSDEEDDALKLLQMRIPENDDDDLVKKEV